eukprot:TRINITY_DN26101_c0_g1_i3.p1 TRINITY_DN26101_c0_g1~~TRINITY_DN26101_c0_g1_i3.p1  ORF type:complete len:234 (-),score=64.59 TRINITY_DN26101_c0_g1_i3:407-1108(-)
MIILFFFFFKQKTAYEMLRSLVGSEMCIRDSLDTHYTMLPLATLTSFMRQLSEALSHIHANGILHMDLKPENVFLHQGTTLKVGDFGNSVKMSQYDDDDGDPIYLAPEVLRGIALPASDVFSLGLIFFEMATRLELPGNGEQWHYLRSGHAAMIKPPDCQWPENLEQLVLPMIHPDPNQRPAAQSVLQVTTSMETSAHGQHLGTQLFDPQAAQKQTHLNLISQMMTEATPMDL